MCGALLDILTSKELLVLISFSVTVLTVRVLLTIMDQMCFFLYHCVFQLSCAFGGDYLDRCNLFL